MLVIPAIDLYQGKVVRFVKGNPAASKVYSEDPVSIARQWKAAGAQWLHIVDLSSALDEGDNFQAIHDIRRHVDIHIEVGGGIRDIIKAKAFLNLGVERIIVGTRGLDDSFLDELLAAFSNDQFIISVDVIDSYVAVRGWKERTSVKGEEVIAHLESKGVKRIAYTDISRDGTLEGINVDALQSLSRFSGVSVIIAGGVASLDDISAVKRELPFVEGVIVGKALYEHTCDLAQAVQLASVSPQDA